MSRTRKILKWVAIVLGFLLGLSVVLVVGLDLWLERSPQLGPEIVTRVEGFTGLRFRYAKIDARLGLYGPELVFRDVGITLPGEKSELFSARAGRVGYDLWRAIRTRHLAAGRVVLEGAQVYAYITEEGIELRGKSTDDQTKLSLDKMPVGHLLIDDSTVVVQDVRRPSPPWRVDRVRLDLARDPSGVDLSARIQLPDSLGARLDVDLSLDGDLATPAMLDWHARLDLSHASLAGWTALVPQWVLPTEGRGDLKARLSGRGATPDHVEATVQLKDVLTPALADRPAIRLPVLAGVIKVDRRDRTWAAHGTGITLDTGSNPWQRGAFDLTYTPRTTAGGQLGLRSALIRLDGLGALARLLPPGRLREASLALDPHGELRDVDLDLRSGDSSQAGRLTGRATLRGFGIGAWEAVPGVTGLDAQLVASGDRGRLVLSSDRFRFDAPRVLLAPLDVDRLRATVDYARSAEGWSFALGNTQIHAPVGRAQGSGRFLLPTDPQVSPRLELDFALADIDATRAVSVLPGQKIHPKAMEWLSQAFLAGRVPTGRLTFTGEVRRFPFRDGGGDFRAQFDFDHLRLHMQDGFGDLDELSGHADFHDGGFSVSGGHGSVHGIALANVAGGIADFKEAELVVDAHTSGDVRDVLYYLQNSLVGPHLGSLFMRLSGRGSASGDLHLVLPFRHFADRSYSVANGRIDRALVQLPGMAEPARDVSASFIIKDREVTVPKLTATVLGGPARLRARTVAGRSGERVLVVAGDGRVAADHLQPLFSIERGEWLSGAADWTLSARFPRLEWRLPSEPVAKDAPPDAVPLVHETEVRLEPAVVTIESNLAGLSLGFPAPLSKPASEPRPLRVDFTLDPGLTADAPQMPLPHRHDPSRDAAIQAHIGLGSDGASFEWHDDGSQYRFERGTLHFGVGPVLLHDAPGIWIDGRIPDYDLSAWLRVKVRDETPAVGAAGASLGELLAGGYVAVDRFGIFGFHFPNVSLRLRADGSAWRADVDGPAAQGTIIVPWDLQGERRFSLDLERLLIGEYAAGGGAVDDDDTDPTSLPALDVKVRNLEVQKRRFGSLDAALSRADTGLRLDRATLKGNSFEAHATGGWWKRDGARSSTLTFALDSTDVKDTLSAWGLEQTLTGKAAHATGTLGWSGGVDVGLFGRATGNVKVSVEKGELVAVNPGAGRVLGLLSLNALPRRLTLDFRDVTEKGFAFDTIRGDFEFRDGNAHTNNLVLKGPAAEIGVVGRTGLLAHDYDQTAKVTGHVGGPIAAAGVLAAGPAVGAALLLFSTVFKEPLGGITGGYYRITGSWDKPVVERIGAADAQTAKPPAPDPSR